MNTHTAWAFFYRYSYFFRLSLSLSFFILLSWSILIWSGVSLILQMNASLFSCLYIKCDVRAAMILRFFCCFVVAVIRPDHQYIMINSEKRRYFLSFRRVLGVLCDCAHFRKLSVFVLIYFERREFLTNDLKWCHIYRYSIFENTY